MNISSRQEVDTTTIRNVAAQWLHVQIVEIESIGGGRNSRVYRMTDAQGANYAVKAYFQHRADARDRLGTEFNALRFLWENGVRQIPRPLATVREINCALYEYVIGERIAPDTITPEHIDDAARFLARLRSLTPAARNTTIGEASEACFSISATVTSIRNRLPPLLATPDERASFRAMRVFLRDQFAPRLLEVGAWCREQATRAEIRFEEEIGGAEHTLSPSDFGFHNALERTDGSIVYLDFEYFGWDDPAKTIADFLLHPAMNLPKVLKKRFCSDVLARFADYPRLARRVEIVYPLFGFKWCLILLNEFLPENLLRRQFAGASNHQQEEIQMLQLEKAKRMLNTVMEEYRHFDYA